MQQNGVSSSKLIKNNARKLLLAYWPQQVLVFLAASACNMAIVSAGSAFGGVVSGITGNEQVRYDVASVFILIGFVLCLPLVYGVIRHEMLLTNGEETHVGDIFYAYTDSAVFFRAFALFFEVIFRSLPAFLPAIVFAVGTFGYYEPGMFGFTASFGGVDIVYYALNIAFVMLVLFGFVYSSRYFEGVYISILHEKDSTSNSFFIAKFCAYSSEEKIWKCALGFVPLLLLSLFTFGFLLIAYALPLMCLTFVGTARFNYNQEMEKMKNGNIVYNRSEDNESMPEQEHFTEAPSEEHEPEDASSDDDGAVNQ